MHVSSNPDGSRSAARRIPFAAAVVALFASVAAVALLVLSDRASAISLKTVVAPIYQVGTGAAAQIGHTVIASTNYNRLAAGGISFQSGNGESNENSSCIP